MRKLAMKLCLLQPPYPKTKEDKENAFLFLLATLSSAEGDVILLPEYSAALGMNSREEIETCGAHNARLLLTQAQKTAGRTGGLVILNTPLDEDEGLRNTTFVIDRTGVLFRYHKQHLPPAEREELRLDHRYAQTSPPDCVFEHNGVRYGFLTCYDAYFSEHIEYLSRQNCDLLLFPAYQRGEREDVLLSQLSGIALRCNAFCARCSVAMGAGDRGGQTAVAGPDGQILQNLGQTVGTLSLTIEPHRQYTQSAGYGRGQTTVPEFLAYGATPQAYPPAPRVLPDAQMPYPRLCAHRGFPAAAPENTLPSFAMAIAFGAQEIELDLWPSSDGELFCCHDPTLERTTDGAGLLYTKPAAYLRSLDAGSRFSPAFRGTKLCTLEEVLRLFSGAAVLNLHIKSIENTDLYDPETLLRIAGLLRKYGCERHAYFAGDADVLRSALRFAPDIPRACLCGQMDGTIVERAIEFRCQKLQFHISDFNSDMLRSAHAHSIRANLFWADDPTEAEKLLKMGVDTLLTNNLPAIRNHVAPLLPAE